MKMNSRLAIYNMYCLYGVHSLQKLPITDCDSLSYPLRNLNKPSSLVIEKELKKCSFS